MRQPSPINIARRRPLSLPAGHEASVLFPADAAQRSHPQEPQAARSGGGMGSRWPWRKPAIIKSSDDSIQ
jgi:hypothetical protein